MHCGASVRELYGALAECVALWGKPEQAVHGTKGKRATIWWVNAFELMTCVTRGGGGCAGGVYSHSPDLQCFSS